MPNLRDISSWISRAKLLEESDYGKALSLYETAERCIYELSILTNIPPYKHPYSEILKTIFSAYKRLENKRKGELTF